MASSKRPNSEMKFTVKSQYTPVPQFISEKFKISTPTSVSFTLFFDFRQFYRIYTHWCLQLRNTYTYHYVIFQCALSDTVNFEFKLAYHSALKSKNSVQFLCFMKIYFDITIWFKILFCASHGQGPSEPRTQTFGIQGSSGIVPILIVVSWSSPKLGLIENLFFSWFIKLAKSFVWALLLASFSRPFHPSSDF